MEKLNYGLECFENGLNCSQAVLTYFCNDLGLPRETAMKIACGFAGGMRHGEVCGAVSGALMVIGLKYGQQNDEDTEAKEKTYKLVQKFVANFRNLHGSITCRDIIGVNITSEEGRNKAKKEGLFQKICPVFINDAIEILESL